MCRYAHGCQDIYSSWLWMFVRVYLDSTVLFFCFVLNTLYTLIFDPNEGATMSHPEAQVDSGRGGARLLDRPRQLCTKLVLALSTSRKFDATEIITMHLSLCHKSFDLGNLALEKNERTARTNPRPPSSSLVLDSTVW